MVPDSMVPDSIASGGEESFSKVELNQELEAFPGTYGELTGDFHYAHQLHEEPQRAELA
jgi:hypothetical protein